jgi:hypothetical protein
MAAFLLFVMARLTLEILPLLIISVPSFLIVGFSAETFVFVTEPVCVVEESLIVRVPVPSLRIGWV